LFPVAPPDSKTDGIEKNRKIAQNDSIHGAPKTDENGGNKGSRIGSTCSAEDDIGMNPMTIMSIAFYIGIAWGMFYMLENSYGLNIKQLFCHFFPREAAVFGLLG